MRPDQARASRGSQALTAATSRVLFVHCSYTGGHRSAAEAVKEHLDREPAADARIVNAVDHLWGAGAGSIKIGVNFFIVRNLPWLRSAFFRLLYRGSRATKRFCAVSVETAFGTDRTFLRLLSDVRPGVIVTCDAASTALLGRWKRRKTIDTRVHALLTDYRAHCLWAQDAVDRYYVACGRTAEDLGQYGVRGDRIRVTGIPVKRKFLRSSELTRSELRAKLGLLPTKFTVLTMGGSLGLGRFREAAHVLSRSGLPLQGVFVTGRNGRRKAELVNLSRRLPVPLKVVGFADNLDEWVEASDVVVTRAGAMTTSEIVAKGRPMIRLASGEYLEQVQAEHLRASGRNFIACDPGRLGAALAQLVSDG